MNRKIVMTKKRKNYVIVFALFVLFLAVGYATFVQPLADKLPLFSLHDWNVGFVDAERVGITGNATENQPVSYTLTRGYFYVSLHQPGDSVTYDFTIKNLGSIKAKVQSIYAFATNDKTDAILFKVDGLKVGDVLNPGETVKLRVKASYNENIIGPPATSRELYVIVNYVQK